MIKKPSLLLLFFLFSLYTMIRPERLVSLSPGITEILFRLGKGKSIVGNTTFCNFPEEAKSVEKVGGFLDMNRELIISLRPDIIFHYPEHRPMLLSMEQYADLVCLQHKSLNDLFGSITTISSRLGISEEGSELVSEIKKVLDGIKLRNSGNVKKVLMVISHDPGILRNITIIGQGDFLNDLIMIAGGTNAYKGDVLYPLVSIESIIKMDPDLIIEFALGNPESTTQDIRGLWSGLVHIRAVREQKIFVIKEDSWVRPGPRITEAAESLYRIINKSRN